MDEKPIIRPKYEPEVLEAMRKRGNALDLGRYRMTPPATRPATPPASEDEKNGLAKVFFAIVSAVTAGAVIYAAAQGLDKAEPEAQNPYSSTLSVPIDMTPAPKAP